MLLADYLTLAQQQLTEPSLERSCLRRSPALKAYPSAAPTLRHRRRSHRCRPCRRRCRRLRSLPLKFLSPQPCFWRTIPALLEFVESLLLPVEPSAQSVRSSPTPVKSTLKKPTSVWSSPLLEFSKAAAVELLERPIRIPVRLLVPPFSVEFRVQACYTRIAVKNRLSTRFGS